MSVLAMISGGGGGSQFPIGNFSLFLKSNSFVRLYLGIDCSGSVYSESVNF